MRTLAAAAAFLLVTPALAQEPPAAKPAAAKHVNKISDEAKALLDGAGKKAYSPIALGLKTLKGTIEQKMERKMEGMPEMPDMPNMPKMPGMGPDVSRFSLDFTAPGALKVTMKEDGSDASGGGMGGGRGMGGGGGEMMKKGKIQAISTLVLNSLGVIGPPADSEYDAEVVTEGGQKVLLMTTYENDVKNGTMRMFLNDESLPTRGVMKVEGGEAGGGRGGRGGMGGMQMEMTWEWGKDGDRYLLQKTSMKSPMMQQPIETVNTYADIGGYKLLSGWSQSMKMGGMEMNTTTHYVDLEVNGKKVDVPAAKEAGPAKTALPPAKAGKGKHEGKGKDEDGEEEEDEDDEKGEK